MKNSAIILLAITFLAGCSSLKVSTDYNREYDFSKIKTYAWTTAPDDILNKPEEYKNKVIPEAIDMELALVGLQKKDLEKGADALVYYYVKTKQMKGYTSSLDHEKEPKHSAGIIIGNDHISPKKSETELYEYSWEEAKLTVTIEDQKTRKTVWEGTVKLELNRSGTNSDEQKLLQKAVEKLMNRYPPGI